MSRGRSTSPHPLHDADVEMDVDTKIEKPDARVVIITNLSNYPSYTLESTSSPRLISTTSAIHRLS